MSDAEAKRLNALLFYALVLILAYLTYRIVAPFLQPLVWAGILALCAQPLHRYLLVRSRPTVAALISTVAVGLLIMTPAVLLMVALLGEAGAAFTELQGAVVRIRESERLLAVWTWIEAHLPLPSPEVIRERLAELATTLSRFLAGQGGAILQMSSVFVFKWFVALFALFFFLRDGQALVAFIRKILPFEERRKEALMERTRNLVFAGSMATLTVAIVQGLAGGILFAVLGLRAPIFWGVVMGFCSLLPLFGTTVIWGPAAVALLVSGDWVRGILMLVLGVVVVGGLDNILRPALLSGKAQMNGLIVFISLLGGVAAFGFIGVVLGPVITAAFLSVLQLGVEDVEEKVVRA